MGPEIYHIDPSVHADPITLDIYPLEQGQSTFTLYDDDGESLGYQRGEQSFTQISALAEEHALTIKVGADIGSYKGKPDSHHYILKINLIDKAYTSVLLNGQAVTKQQPQNFTETNQTGWYLDTEMKTLWISFATSAEQANKVEIK
jgi:hypothetical protein